MKKGQTGRVCMRALTLLKPYYKDSGEWLLNLTGYLTMSGLGDKPLIHKPP